MLKLGRSRRYGVRGSPPGDCVVGGKSMERAALQVPLHFEMKIEVRGRKTGRFVRERGVLSGDRRRESSTLSRS
jgi:hypothetical protein